MSNADSIAQFLSTLGFTKAGTAGTLGAWQAESGLNPSAVNRSSGATGLAQWLGSRLAALRSLASSMGVSDTNLNAQLEYFKQEITSPQYSGLLHELQTTNDPAQAARDVVTVFERPGPGGDASAPANAQQFFTSGTLPGASGSVSTSGGTTATDAGNGTSAWWTAPIPGWGIMATIDPNKAKQTIGGVSEGLAAVGDALSSFVNFLTLIFQPSFWLRVGAFLLGLILLVGGIVIMAKASS